MALKSHQPNLSWSFCGALTTYYVSELGCLQLCSHYNEYSTIFDKLSASLHSSLFGISFTLSGRTFLAALFPQEQNRLWDNIN